ncbi:hypothetical protein [Mucilaginibacter sp.]
MKKFAKVLLATAVIGLTGLTAKAQIIVRIHPARPAVVVARPVAPGPGAVWVDEDWAPRNGTYAWHGGYWAVPPHPGAFYVRGHWRETRRGSIWIPGHWR